MASALYPKAKEKFLSGAINLISDTIKVALIDTETYTYSASHEWFSDISAAVVGTPVTIASNKSVTNGVFDADNVVVNSVSGDDVEAVIIYKDTGNPNTSALIAYIDSGSGLPVTPNGGNINVNWNDGPSKIFAI